MTEDHFLRHVRLRAWRSRGVWFWAIAGIATSVFVLFVGSQIAHDRGQSVEWYTGFGQWLGGLGSLIAAGVALWIAVTERRHVERQREADLMRPDFGHLVRRSGTPIWARASRRSAGSGSAAVRVCC